MRIYDAICNLTCVSLCNNIRRQQKHFHHVPILFFFYYFKDTLRAHSVVILLSVHEGFLSFSSMFKYFLEKVFFN